ncbi:hypothetical protein [Edaphosphingomonas haloaromaticamans]|uniref:Uncharacterized protein n=1 Tax=Edaphosphingomonas haloaromaticamans TaxID=653954 RepID=A0A1S1HDS2_9SPHN|nr:hypothetical protein [Sphingomonas haloaromaticamans]OHT19942.1 hypothetical protein BHE75_01935 [Sphingomonas haloaromaticamans]
MSTTIEQNIEYDVRAVAAAMLEAGYMEEDEHDAIVGRAGDAHIELYSTDDVATIINDIDSDDLIAEIRERGDYDPRRDREGDIADFLREALLGNRTVAMALAHRVAMDDKEAYALELVLRAHCRRADADALPELRRAVA